jgi:peptide/nickel transport system ATP-binding protein
MDLAVHWALFPGLAIFITVLTINFIGDGLRDALDPRGCSDAPARHLGASRPTSRPTTAGCMPSTAWTSPSTPARPWRGRRIGCGKSVTAKTVMKLIDMPPGKIVAGQVLWQGRDLVPLPAERDAEDPRQGDRDDLPGADDQPEPGLHRGRADRRKRAPARRPVAPRGDGPRGGDAGKLVRIPTPERRVNDYPHQFSGGMRQRVMIAMALACNPKLLIADEPTTALDVTIQAQILDLMQELKDRLGMAVMLITHAMGVVAEVAQKVVVMYAGKVVEEAPSVRCSPTRATPTPGPDPLHPAHRHGGHAQGAAGSHPRHRAQADRTGAGLPLCRALQACMPPACTATPPLREVGPATRWPVSWRRQAA